MGHRFLTTGQISIAHANDYAANLASQGKVIASVAERKEKIRAGDVLGALTGPGGISGDCVGKIAIAEFSTYVAVRRDLGKLALAHLGSTKVKGKTVRVRLL